jgi:hypothetical protein
MHDRFSSIPDRDNARRRFRVETGVVRPRIGTATATRASAAAAHVREYQTRATETLHRRTWSPFSRIDLSASDAVAPLCLSRATLK